MEKIQQYDRVRLADGRVGCVVEIYGDQEAFDVDVGSSPKDWDTVSCEREDITKILSQPK